MSIKIRNYWREQSMSKDNLNIFIFGLGAIGSNLLVQLVKKYPQYKYFGVDYDIVEERNLMTQAYFKPHIGQLKVRALTPVLSMKLNKFNYEGKMNKIQTGQDIDAVLRYNVDTDKQHNLFVDCFDNSESRALLHKHLSASNIVHVGFSPQYSAEILWGHAYSVPKDIPEDQNDICEMTEAIPFIQFVVSLACMNISEFVDNDNKKNLIITNKLRIQYLD